MCVCVCACVYVCVCVCARVRVRASTARAGRTCTSSAAVYTWCAAEYDGYATAGWYSSRYSSNVRQLCPLTSSGWSRDHAPEAPLRGVEVRYGRPFRMCVLSHPPRHACGLHPCVRPSAAAASRKPHSLLNSAFPKLAQSHLHAPLRTVALGLCTEACHVVGCTPVGDVAGWMRTCSGHSRAAHGAVCPRPRR